MIPLSEKVKPLIEDAIERLDDGTITTWEHTVSVLMGPTGAVPISLLSIFFKSPLLGHPDLSMSQVNPLASCMFNQDMFDVAVRNSIGQARDARVALLAMPDG